MRFTSPADYLSMLKINRELVNTIIDTPIVLYKLNQETTQVNSYGEATTKVWYVGVQMPAMIKREQQNPVADMQTMNFGQTAEFWLLRQECQDRNIYPESGDIINFYNDYWEIDNTNENQLYAGREEYNHSIVCECHLTRSTGLQLERPQA